MLTWGGGETRGAVGVLLVISTFGGLTSNKMAKPKFALVRWTGEETLSVVAAISVRHGLEVHVGVFRDFKWAGKFYEGEVLSLSGNLPLSYS